MMRSREVKNYAYIDQELDFVGRISYLPGQAPALDVPLLRKEVEWIDEEHARQESGRPTDGDMSWDQGVWVRDRASCSTACCLAGNVALKYGTPIFNSEEPSLADYVRSYEDGKIYIIKDFAAMKLGVDTYWASRLFDASNQASTIRECAEYLVLDRTGERL